MRPRNAATGGDPLQALVVDDEENARNAVARVLKRLGCEVTFAASARDAVLAFLSGGFDLITLDHRMPGLSGIDLHKLLSHEFGAGRRKPGAVPGDLPPIVVVTGYPEDPEVLRGRFGESIVGVVEKADVPEGLARVVGGLLARKGPESGKDGG